MDLANWLQNRLDKIKEENKDSLQKPKPGTIDWLLEESKRIEIAKLESERLKDIARENQKKLSQEVLEVKLTQITLKYEKKKQSCGLGKSTINRVKSGKGKVSNSTIEKLKRAFDVESITDDNKGYFCFEHKSVKGVVECDVCQKKYAVYNSVVEGLVSCRARFESHETLSGTLSNIGVSLHCNKQLLPKFSANYEMNLITNSSLPYLKYKICDSCLKRENVRYALEASYPELLAKIINDYPQYNLEKLAYKFKISEITLTRISNGITNYLSHDTAKHLVNVILFEKPQNQRELAGIIQHSVFTNPDKNLFDDFFKLLLSLGLRFHYAYKNEEQKKFMLLERNYFSQKEIEAKFNKQDTTSWQINSNYELAKLLLKSFLKYIGKNTPKRVKISGPIPMGITLDESGYIDIEEYLLIFKKPTFSSIHSTLFQPPHSIAFKIFINSIASSLRLESNEVNDFFRSEDYLKIKGVNDPNFRSGHIILNHEITSENQAGLMSTKTLTYTCPILIKFTTNKYFSTRGINEKQTLVCFPVRKSSTSFKVDYLHIANIYEATMICLMEIDSNDREAEFIKKYRYFYINKGQHELDLSIESISSPFTRNKLAW